MHVKRLAGTGTGLPQIMNFGEIYISETLDVRDYEALGVSLDERMAGKSSRCPDEPKSRTIKIGNGCSV